MACNCPQQCKLPRAIHLFPDAAGSDAAVSLRLAQTPCLMRLANAVQALIDAPGIPLRAISLRYNSA
jgi:hypothetical protein